MSAPDRHAELTAMLRTLRLPAIAEVFADLALKAAKAGMTHEAFLYELVRSECEQREQRRTARLLQQSGLPAEKTFRTLRLDRFPPAVRQQVERLRRGVFVPEAINVVAVGNPGAGKPRARNYPARYYGPAGGYGGGR
jgi:DNA replication protein DnaC